MYLQAPSLSERAGVRRKKNAHLSYTREIALNERSEMELYMLNRKKYYYK